MNQILTVDLPKSRTGSYKNRFSNKADIRTVIIVFSIILILFALIVIIIAVSTLKKDEQQPNNDTPVITGTQPSINVEIQSNTILNIIVSHDKQISSIVYSWNDGEKIEVNDVGENTKEIEIEIPAGTNTLNISVTDINGVTQNYSEQHSGTPIIDGPRLVLEEVKGEGIKISAQSTVEIAYISYNWNGNEEQQIVVNDLKFEQLIEVPMGANTLNVVLVDIEGGETTDTIKMVGDLKPTLDIKTDKVYLYLKGSDDEGLKKLTIEVYDTGEKQDFELTGKEFTKKLKLPYQDNKLIITLYNINDIQKEQRVRVVK